MNVSEFLTDLTRQDIQVWVDNDKLNIRSPKGVVTPELRQELATHKADIIAFLSQIESAASSTSEVFSEAISLQTIGRLIGGFSDKLTAEYKPPVIDSRTMAQHLTVTFRPLPPGYKKERILKFREELELKLRHYGVKVLPWEDATTDFNYEIEIPFIKSKKKIQMRAVKVGINAVIDVERTPTLKNRVERFIAEKIYEIYSKFVWKNQQPSIYGIGKIISWAEEHAGAVGRQRGAAGGQALDAGARLAAHHLDLVAAAEARRESQQALVVDVVEVALLLPGEAVYVALFERSPLRSYRPAPISPSTSASMRIWSTVSARLRSRPPERAGAAAAAEAEAAAKRRELVERFQSGAADCFLISLKAGGSGLNLTAASYVIHIDPWWNPAAEDQATDRAHRIGQEKPVTVYRLVTSGTVEEKILDLHREKRDLVDAVLDDSGRAAQLDPEALLALMRDR